MLLASRSSGDHLMRSNVQLYRLKQRKKIELLKLKLRYDYRCDVINEMKISRYCILRKRSFREDELQRRQLDFFGPYDG